MSDQPPKTTCGKKPVCDFGGQPGQPHPLSLTLLCLSRSNLLLCCQLCVPAASCVPAVPLCGVALPAHTGASWLLALTWQQGAGTCKVRAVSTEAGRCGAWRSGGEMCCIKSNKEVGFQSSSGSLWSGSSACC